MKLEPLSVPPSSKAAVPASVKAVVPVVQNPGLKSLATTDKKKSNNFERLIANLQEIPRFSTYSRYELL